MLFCEAVSVGKKGGTKIWADDFSFHMMKVLQPSLYDIKGVIQPWYCFG